MKKKSSFVRLAAVLLLTACSAGASSPLSTSASASAAQASQEGGSGSGKQEAVELVWYTDCGQL